MSRKRTVSASLDDPKRWAIERCLVNESGWVNIKLRLSVVKSGFVKKKQFMLGWNLNERRWARSHDSQVLKEHYPNLKASLDQYVAEADWDSAFLPIGATP